MMKFNQFTSFILIVFLGSFVFSCGQMTAKDDGLDSKTIEEASGTSGGDSGTDNSSGGTTTATGGFVISAITGPTNEAGGTATFTVNLKNQPTANVSIALSSSDSTEGSVSPASLSFTSSNWSTAQTVTVTGIDDSTIDGNQSYIILLGIASSSDSNFSGLDPSDVSVTNTDDETAGFTISSITDNTSESGGSTFFTFKLNSQPSSDVTIAVSSSDTSEGTANPSSLVFTSSNWSATQSVIITGIDDSLDDGNQNYTVLLEAASSSDSNYNSLDPNDISVTNVDDDTAGFTITNISGVTTEYGGTSTFTIKLNSQPTADVSIAVSSSDTTEGTVSITSLTFASTNWSTTQTVTVTGVNDSAVDGNQSYTVLLGAASSSDSNYNALDPADVSLTNTDDETGGITVSSISGNTTESGGTATFAVKLTSQPSANVSIAVSSSDTTEGTVNPSSLTFTNSNWSADQTVTVTGVDDSTIDGNQSYTVVLAVATSSDSNYNGINPTDVSVINTDDDTAPVSVIISNTGTDKNGITYTSSNLEWQYATAAENDGLSSASGLSWATSNSHSDLLNWTEAGSYCSSLDLNSQIDWRLPTKTELASLIDTSVTAPKIITELHTTTQSTQYWSSTNVVGATTTVWVVVFDDGTVSNTSTYNDFYFRCVRGG
jgi:endonuclease V-like protein UPF0215 family